MIFQLMAGFTYLLWLAFAAWSVFFAYRNPTLKNDRTKGVLVRFTYWHGVLVVIGLSAIVIVGSALAGIYVLLQGLR